MSRSKGRLRGVFGNVRDPLAGTLRIGVIPLPVVIALLGITGYFLRLKKLPPEICVMIGVIGVGGFLCQAYA